MQSQQNVLNEVTEKEESEKNNLNSNNFADMWFPRENKRLSIPYTISKSPTS